MLISGAARFRPSVCNFFYMLGAIPRIGSSHERYTPRVGLRRLAPRTQFMLSRKHVAMTTNEFYRAFAKIAIIGIFVLGCGGSHQSSQDANGATAAERQCIAEANSPPKELNNAPARVTVSHIVIRHKNLPKSDGIIRTRGQACLRALEAREELRDAADWSDVVAHFSDKHEPNDGDLGVIRKGDVDKRLERAAFSLEPGELSYVVETNRGFEIVLRTK